MSNKLGFIGCGKMANAIIKGILDSGFMHTSDIHASTHTDKSASSQSKLLKIKVITDNKEVAKNSEIIFIATKPSQVETVLNEIKDEIKDKLIVSIAAGINTKKIEAIATTSPVIRVMPNTPALVLEAICATCKGSKATDEDEKYIQEILSKIGKVISVDEEQMDIVTAISGSGPAFFYQIFEDMAQAGVNLGLDYDKALLLSVQTAIGAAKMTLNRKNLLTELIASVATKGGCTEVGINTMKKLDIGKLLNEVIKNTTQKAHELG